MARWMSPKWLGGRISPPPSLTRMMLAIAPAGQNLLRAVTPHSAHIYSDLKQRFGPDMLDALSKLKA
jgi:hypothetical protein